MIYVEIQAFENIKQRAKKALTYDKVQMHRTGGGTFVPQVTEIDEKMIALLGYRATPLRNPYDGDASYNNESGLFYCYLAHCNWCIICLLSLCVCVCVSVWAHLF